MIWHLIAALFAGLAAGGIGMLLRTLSGKRLPRWIVPVCAGLGMLGYQIHVEYSWFSHKQTQLPDTAQVVATERERIFWRPWTFAVPMVTAFAVVDEASMNRRETDEGEVVEFLLYRFERHHMDLVTHEARLLHCDSGELLPLIGEERRPRFSDLQRLEVQHPLRRAVCSR